MKNQSGITMISLSLYIISFMIIIGIVGSITVFFSNRTKDINMKSGASSEYNKFNLYMLEYTKTGHQISRISEDTNPEEPFVTFIKDGKTDTFVKLRKYVVFQSNKVMPKCG